MEGTRLDRTNPFTERLVVVTFEPDAFKKPSVVLTKKLVLVELPSDPLLIASVVPVAPTKKLLVVERLVVVTFRPVALVKSMPCKEDVAVTTRFPATRKVPVTEEDAATNPPKSVNVLVATAPRLVTVSNESVSIAATTGQNVPLERQTP